MIDEPLIPPARGKERLLWKILLLTPVVQYAVLLGSSLYSDPDHITCSNWHGEAPPCSLGAALVGSVMDVVLINIFSFGIATLVALAAAAVIVVVFEACVPPRIARSRLLWGAVLGVVVAAIALRGVETGEFDDRTRTPAAGVVEEPSPVIRLVPEKGGAQVVDPAIQPRPPAAPADEAAAHEPPSGSDRASPNARSSSDD